MAGFAVGDVLSQGEEHSGHGSEQLAEGRPVFPGETALRIVRDPATRCYGRSMLLAAGDVVPARILPYEPTRVKATVKVPTNGSGLGSVTVPYTALQTLNSVIGSVSRAGGYIVNNTNVTLGFGSPGAGTLVSSLAPGASAQLPAWYVGPITMSGYNPNPPTTGSVSIYSEIVVRIGQSSDLSGGDGFILYPGDSRDIECTDDVYAISSAAVQLSVWVELNPAA